MNPSIASSFNQRKGRFLQAALGLLLATSNGALAAERTLLDVSADGTQKRLEPSCEQVSVTRSTDPAAPGLLFAIQPGPASYPGVTLKPEGAEAWDLSAFGHVAARVVNAGTNRLCVALRVDNPGDWRDNPWNAEQIYLKPGATGTVTTIFGFAYGNQPGYALKPTAIASVGLFTLKSAGPQSFRLEALGAGGPAGEQPPVDPAKVRVVPVNGLLFGGALPCDAATQLVARSGAQAVLTNDAGASALRCIFPPAKPDAVVLLKPAQGRWDLRDSLEVRVTLRNAGSTPTGARVRVESNGGPTAWTASDLLAPGAVTELVVPFIPAVPWQGVPATDKVGMYDGKPGTGTKLTHDMVSAIAIAAATGAVERLLVVTSVRAAVPPPVVPEWLGKHPPVAGDWVQTLDEPFDGSNLNTNLWNVTGENWYDKRSHYSKDNVILGSGFARLRFERKRGWHNDNPHQPKESSVQSETDYATGFLDTYGKWVQRYGYFESRMKLPTAPGLWPAFWMMPDRGAALGPQWRRASTSDGGMEFDIVEHLTRWGAYRYSVGMHWDGYQKQHKSNGSTFTYVQPDKHGFVTGGLLWTPGSAIFYCNGREVLRWEDPRVSSVVSDILFTLPCGGWDNSPLDDRKLPSDYIIDYVRVWQRRDLASAADGFVRAAAAVERAPAN